MAHTLPIALIGALAMALASPAIAAPDLSADPVLNPDASFDSRHKACLESIAIDPEDAFETAMIWIGRGGGYRARHCEAMALFTLGQEEEAAHRLDKLVAEFPDGSEDPDIDALRVSYSVQAAQSWLQAGELTRAYDAATRALTIDETDADARITRARIYFALDRIADAETDLTSTLAYSPDHADALRYRADARLRQGHLDAALKDAELAFSLTPDVDTALIRGHIREAIAKQATTATTHGDVQ